jgi:hypothetical protein
VVASITGKINTTPREVSEPWPQIIKRLSKTAIRANKDGPLWSPATFKPVRRKKENVKALSLLVLDIDGRMTIDQADAKLRELGAQACIYTTHSHQRITPDHPKAEDCFRIVISLADPIGATDFPRLWEWAIDSEIGRVRMAPAKSRNNAYNKAVYNLARLGIDRAVIESALIPEAEQIGLTKTEIRATLLPP